MFALGIFPWLGRGIQSTEAICKSDAGTRIAKRTGMRGEHERARQSDACVRQAFSREYGLTPRFSTKERAIYVHRYRRSIGDSASDQRPSLLAGREEGDDDQVRRVETSGTAASMTGWPVERTCKERALI